jgi:hypothetical protein
MNSPTKALRTLMVVCPVFVVTQTAAAQQRVTVYADEATYATHQTMTYEATCPSGKYSLRFNQSEKRLEFNFEGRIRTTVDLSNTPFGVTFLGKALQGKFYSTCPKDGIRVYFNGIEPKEGAKLHTVKYRVTIRNDGVIEREDALEEESAQSINFWFLHNAQQ